LCLLQGKAILIIKFIWLFYMCDKIHCLWFWNFKIQTGLLKKFYSKNYVGQLFKILKTKYTSSGQKRNKLLCCNLQQSLLSKSLPSKFAKFISLKQWIFSSVSEIFAFSADFLATSKFCINLESSFQGQSNASKMRSIRTNLNGKFCNCNIIVINLM